MKITAEAERFIDAPAARLYSYISDFRRHHPHFLPPQFSDFEVESGGVGAGTVHRFRMTLGGRSETYRVRVGEPRPGRVLIESDPSRSMLTTFTVEPQPGGGTLVGITTRWYTDGVKGLVERLVAPRMLAGVYREELRLLDRYAAAQREPTRTAGRAA
jgi:Polyketide cyclase / dehydrase and lipid transport